MCLPSSCLLVVVQKGVEKKTMNLQLSNFGLVTSVTVQLFFGFQRYWTFDSCIIIVVVVVDNVFFTIRRQRDANGQ